jgi:hypothetical protein
MRWGGRLCGSKKVQDQLSFECDSQLTEKIQKHKLNLSDSAKQRLFREEKLLENKKILRIPLENPDLIPKLIKNPGRRIQICW